VHGAKGVAPRLRLAGRRREDEGVALDEPQVDARRRERWARSSRTSADSIGTIAVDAALFVLLRSW
jgi:hypothetical protein